MPAKTNVTSTRRGIPRGLAKTGPAVLSYGFRPFFLAASLWAITSMVLWLGAVIMGWQPGGNYGAVSWHAHELLFGYTSAVLAGFMLTAIPNWTGRLPLSGRPLLGLVVVWAAGRVALGAIDLVGVVPAIVIEASFLPLLAAVAAREIVAGKNWKNLHIVVALSLLTAANIWFHVSVVHGQGSGAAIRLAISIWIMLISLLGGRLSVSFTRNWLAKRGETKFPASLGLYDRLTLLGTFLTLALWVTAPNYVLTGWACAGASILHAIRLSRWRGWAAISEPLVLVLHVAYAFIPLGLAAIAAASFGFLGQTSALHLLTAGVIGNMTVAVMTRVSRGHTGRPLAASAMTTVTYSAMALSALLRPVVDFMPEHYQLILSASAGLWILGFALFVFEYGPMLVRPRAS